MGGSLIFVVLGNYESERPFCTASVCLVFDNTWHLIIIRALFHLIVTPPGLKKKIFFYTAWPLYSLDSGGGGNLVKMKLFQFQDWPFFVYAVGESWLDEVFFSEF